MANKTSIEWCDSTFNPWIGCTKVSPGCDHCYAERQMDKRLWRVRWGAGQPRQRTSTAYWRQPERWDKADFRACGFCGWRGEIDTLVDDACPSCRRHEKLNPARRRVFSASLADVFDTEVPLTWLVDLLDLIRRTPNLDWLLLTKRIGNVTPRLGAVARLAGKIGEEGDKVASDTWGMAFDWLRDSPPENVWLGATVVNQAEADRDFPKLLATPAAKRFMSIEPMLGPIDLSWPLAANALRKIDGGPAIDWVIAGGESGPGARPMNPAWVLSLRDQCQVAGVPFFFKQWGAWAPNCLCDKNTACREIRRPEPGEPGVMFRCGKAGGREIHWREWLEFPA